MTISCSILALGTAYVDVNNTDLNKMGVHTEENNYKHPNTNLTATNNHVFSYTQNTSIDPP